jgi:hypothetical protein
MSCACRVGGGLPSSRTRFVFSVCRLVSRRCHAISSILGCPARPSQNRACAIHAHGSSHRLSRALARYAMQFRCHRFSAAGRGRCFFTSLDHVSSPFLRRHYPPSLVLRDNPTPYARCGAASLLRLLAPSPIRGSTHRVSRVAALSQCHACHGLRPRGAGEARPIQRRPC